MNWVLKPLRVVKALDVPEDPEQGLLARREALATEELFLEAGEEALGDGVVPGVADRAHREVDPGLLRVAALDQTRVLGAIAAHCGPPADRQDSFSSPETPRYRGTSEFPFQGIQEAPHTFGAPRRGLVAVEERPLLGVDQSAVGGLISRTSRVMVMAKPESLKVTNRLVSRDSIRSRRSSSTTQGGYRRVASGLKLHRLPGSVAVAARSFKGTPSPALRTPTAPKPGRMCCTFAL
jgi:hypothetical protein